MKPGFKSTHLFSQLSFSLILLFFAASIYPLSAQKKQPSPTPTPLVNPPVSQTPLPNKPNALPGQNQDEKNIAGTAAFNEALKLVDAGTAESMRTAAVKYSEARNLFHQAGNKYGEGLCLIQIAKLKSDLDENPEALTYANQALELTSKSPVNPDLVVFALNQLGELYEKTGEYGKAIQSYARALDLTQISGDKDQENSILYSLATVYNDLGETSKAFELYEKTLKYYHDKGDHPMEARTLNNMGFSYYKLFNFQKAYDLYNQSYQASIDAKDETGQAATLIGIGDALLKLNKPQEALDRYNRGMALSIKVGNQYFVGYALTGIGNTYHFLKDYEYALDFYNRALSLQRRIKNPDEESKTLSALMQLAIDLRKPQTAILYGKQAVNVNQQIRRNLKALDKSIQQSYLKSKESTYRRLADILISEGRLPEAQAILDMLKEEEFKAVVRSGETTDTIPYSKAEADTMTKVESVAALEREQSDLLKLKSDGALPADKQARLDRIPNEIEAANKAFRISLETLAKAETTVSARIEELEGDKILQSVLGELSEEMATGAVALYTVLGTEEAKDKTDRTKTKFGWIILVTPNSRKAYPIDVKDLEQTVFQFRAALSSDKYNPQPLAQKLYDALFRQTSGKQKTTLETDLETLLGDQKHKTLMWSLDGILRYVPAAALHDGKQYLVEKYQNVVFTKESIAWLTKPNKAKWQALGMGISDAETVELADGKKISFGALAGTEKELRDIIRGTPQDPGIFDGAIKLNKDFTKESAFRSWREGTYQVVHIASHYSFNPTSPTDSFLLVGDGRLTFADLQDKLNLFGKVDLLTLSACDTAMGGANGKEAEGFAYLAQSLGAKTVIASLWKVSDVGTPELMIRFYKLRVENPQMSKGEAFRQAQMSMLGIRPANSAPNSSKGVRSDLAGADQQNIDLPLFKRDESQPFAHPHYWSSFVLIGNWR